MIDIVISQFDEQIQYVKCHMKEKQDFAHVIMKHVPELIVDRRRVYETTERSIRGDVYMAMMCHVMMCHDDHVKMTPGNPRASLPVAVGAAVCPAKWPADGAANTRAISNML